MAIEFYDSQYNEEFHDYYINKINDLLSQDSVVKYLDEVNKHSTNEDNNIYKYDEEIMRREMFPNSIVDNINNVDNIELRKSRLDMKLLEQFEDKNLDEKVKQNKFKTKNKIIDNVFNTAKTQKVETDKNKEKMNEKLTLFNSNLNKIQDNICSDLKNQSNNFELIKSRKKILIKEKTEKSNCFFIFRNFTVKNK